MIGGAGAAEAVAAMLSIRDGIVPPTANLEQLGDDIDLDVVAGSVREIGRPAGDLELVRLRRAQRLAGADAVRVTGRPKPGATPLPLGARRSDAASRHAPGPRRSAGRRVPFARRQARRRDRAARRDDHRADDPSRPSTRACPSSARSRRRVPTSVEGVSSLHAWGLVAKALTDASGVVPTMLVVVGPCVSGPALLLGLADIVVMTEDAFAYVSGPDTVDGVHRASPSTTARSAAPRTTTPAAASRRSSSPTRTRRRATVASLLDYLPGNHLDDPPRWATDDPVDRDCARAATAVPARSNASYDVRTVDRGRPRRRDASSSCGRATPATSSPRSAGSTVGPVGIVANQPQQRAGHDRHRGVGEGGALRAVVRLLQHPDRHVRRHARLRAGQATSSGAG